jgi:hypothetical protein
MDSSFLTFVSLGLGLFSAMAFLKLVIQFGLPNHPARFTAYLVSLCATFYFCGKAATGLGLITPWLWMKWSPVPIVAGSFALLLQAIMTIGDFSLIQQKIVSRVPLIASLLCFAFFPEKALILFMASVAAGCLFLGLAAGKARHQRRLFFKMTLFLGLVGLFRASNVYALYVIGELMLFFVLFYFFLFEQTFGIAAMMDKGVRG